MKIHITTEKMQHVKQVITMSLCAVVLSGPVGTNRAEEKQDNYVPLAEFAKIGKEDTPEKAVGRQFAHPVRDKNGLWVGSIPNRAKVWVHPFSDAYYSKWTNVAFVGFTPLFLQDLQPGRYHVAVQPTKHHASDFGAPSQTFKLGEDIGIDAYSADWANPKLRGGTVLLDLKEPGFGRLTN